MCILIEFILLIFFLPSMKIPPSSPMSSKTQLTVASSAPKPKV